MYQWRPSKWIKWAPLTILPFVAGAWLQTGGLVDDVVSRAQTAAGESTKVAIDGRDATLTGEVTSQEALESAGKAVLGTYGVRTVDTSGVKIVVPVAPVTLAAPIIAPLASATTAWPYAISGTWPEGVATGLSVKLADKVYALGTDAALTSDGKGNFSFDPRVDLKPGSYDLSFMVSDAAGNKADSVAAAAIVIPEAAAPVVEPPKVEPPKVEPPKVETPKVETPKAEAIPLAAPTAVAMGANSASPTLMGTYPKEAAKLAVDVGGKSYVLGTDKELTVDSAGNWTLKPSGLVDGGYSVTARVEDAAGASTSSSLPQNLTIDTVGPALPTVAPAAAGAVWPYAITGTWPEGDAVAMSLSLAGKAYALGKDKELISDGKGTYTFMPSTTLAPGSYDISMTVIDGLNNITQTVSRAAIVIPEPPPPPPVLDRPTVTNAAADNDHPMIMGTYPSATAKNLTVALDGKSYVLGTDPELTAKGNDWMLMPKMALSNGTYNVVAHVSDDAGQRARDATQGELVVNVVAPAPEPAPAPAPAPAALEPLAAPTVESGTSDSDHPTVKGTWPAGKANSLIVTLDGTSYKLGTDFDLLSNAAGQWTLKPKKPIVNGTYDVIAQISDSAGQTGIDATKGELIVNVAPPPPPPPAAQPYDCIATLARISAVFPVRFEFNKDTLKSPYDSASNQYAALLKDPRCVALKIQVAGHADFKGSEKYNQGLSERRAKMVIDALEKAGVTADRLSSIGFSEDKPLDPALDDSARMKNRRVEFTVTQ
jgi:outer membrane protein OmpA-like peptidoglycan-associated protein